MLLAALALAVSVVAVASAAGLQNGPILFFSSRSADYFTDIYSIAADGSGRANLTRNPAADGGAALSPDGSRIAFVSHRDGFDAVYLMNADGSAQERLVGRPPDIFTTYGVGSLIWAPTGRRLAFMATQPPVGSFFETRLLYVADVPSGRVRLLGGTGCGGGATFSPEGRYVAFAMVECRSGIGGVRVARADGSAARTVGSGSLMGWAPKGQRVLFLRNTRNRKIQQLATVDPFGRRRWELGGNAASAAAWSPGGGLIAFARNAGRRPGIFVIRPGTRRARRILSLAKSASIAWSPNGAWLALATARAQGVRIYLVRPSGRGLRRVSDARSLPIWSRDSRHVAFVDIDGAARVASLQGAAVQRVTDPATDAVATRLEWDAQNRLVFESVRRGAGSSYVLAVEPDGTGVRQITPDAAPVGRISPDGSRIAFVRDSHIWTAGLDGGDARQLTSGAALDGAPAWSSDGQQIAFARSTSSATSDIFVVDSSGGAARQVTHNDVGFSAGGPAWSPDGGWIAFLSFGQLLAVHPDGSGRHAIASIIGLRAYGEPAWSPDGTRLALGGCGIAVVNADRGGVRELTGSGVREGQPAWSPDGTKIVFTRSVTPCPTDFTADSDLWTINPDGSGEKRLTDGPWPDVLPSWQPVRP